MQELIRKLSDLFFITGTFVTGAGVLSLVSALGGFDGLAYLFYSLRVRSSASRTKWDSRKDFYEYRLERRKKKGRRPGRLIMAGLIALVLAAMFAAAYALY